MGGITSHRIHGQTLELLVERALYWKEERTVLVADLHLGKEGVFRTQGIPLPDGPSDDTLARLSLVLRGTGAERLIILGDLFHGEHAIESTEGLVGNWRRNFSSLQVDLVNGSHDRWSGELPARWEITAHNNPLQAGPFFCSHYPEVSEQGYVLSGHLHPGYLLRDRLRRDQVRLPCFYFQEHTGILPAFGSFTGLVMVIPKAGEHCYLVGDERVIQVA